MYAYRYLLGIEGTFAGLLAGSDLPLRKGECRVTKRTEVGREIDRWGTLEAVPDHTEAWDGRDQTWNGLIGMGSHLTTHDSQLMTA